MNISSFPNKMASLLILLLISLSLDLTISQYMSPGLCPKLPTVQNLDINRYSGRWYEVEKYWFMMEATARCVNVLYYKMADGNSTFGVEISLIENMTRNRLRNIGRTFHRPNADQNAADFRLELLINQSPIPFIFPWNYLVLDTDYDNYTAKYTCTQAGPIKLQYLWILSRKQTLDEEIRRKLHANLEAIGVSTRLLRGSNQNCEFDGRENGIEALPQRN